MFLKSVSDINKGIRRPAELITSAAQHAKTHTGSGGIACKPKTCQIVVTRMREATPGEPEVGYIALFAVIIRVAPTLPSWITGAQTKEEK